MKDLKKVERAMKRRQKALGIEPAPPASDEVSDFERNSALGRAVRLEIDVCIPLAELRQNLASVRNEVTNALASMDKFPLPGDKRKAIHWAMGTAKAQIYYRKREREMRDLRKPQP
jgi:hypothetical protein